MIILGVLCGERYLAGRTWAEKNSCEVPAELKSNSV